MEWNRGDMYFIKLIDGSCITGTVNKTDNSLGFNIIEMTDKYNKIVGFREDRLDKYELLIKVNKVNNKS